MEINATLMGYIALVFFPFTSYSCTLYLKGAD